MSCNLTNKKILLLSAFCLQKATSSSRSTIREVQCYFLSQPITVKETEGCLFYIFLFAKKLGSIIHSAKGWCIYTGVVSVTSTRQTKVTGAEYVRPRARRSESENRTKIWLCIFPSGVKQAICSRNHEASRTAQLSPPSHKLLVSVCVSNITIRELLLS